MQTVVWDMGESFSPNRDLGHVLGVRRRDCETPYQYCNPKLDPAYLQKRNRNQVMRRYGEKLNDAKSTAGQTTHALSLSVPRALIWVIDELVIVNSAIRLPGNFWSFLYHKTRLAEDAQAEQLVGLITSRLIDSEPGHFARDFSERPVDSFAHFLNRLYDRMAGSTNSNDLEKYDSEDEWQCYDDIMVAHGEVRMIQTVLQQQEDVWDNFVSAVWPEKSVSESPSATTDPLDKPAGTRPENPFPLVKRQWTKLAEDAVRIEECIKFRLDVKQQRINLEQSRISLQESHTASIMGAAVLGFTIITVIFTPLSFLAALFALNISGYPNQGSSSTNTNLESANTTSGSDISVPYEPGWIAWTMGRLFP